MAVKIVDLPSETAPTDDDYIIIRDNATGTTRRVTRANFFLNPPLPALSITTAMLANLSVTKGKLEANARIDPRISSLASSSAPALNVSTTDILKMHSLAVNTVIDAPTGTPVDGQAFIYMIRDNGSSRTVGYNAIFRPIGITPPGSTVAGKWMYLSGRYNAQDVKYDLLSVGRE